jgi:hypothetical protein
VLVLVLVLVLLLVPLVLLPPSSSSPPPSLAVGAAAAAAISLFVALQFSVQRGGERVHHASAFTSSVRAGASARRYCIVPDTLERVKHVPANERRTSVQHACVRACFQRTAGAALTVHGAGTGAAVHRRGVHVHMSMRAHTAFCEEARAAARRQQAARLTWSVWRAERPATATTACAT